MTDNLLIAMKNGTSNSKSTQLRYTYEKMDKKGYQKFTSLLF